MTSLLGVRVRRRYGSREVGEIVAVDGPGEEDDVFRFLVLVNNDRFKVWSSDLVEAIGNEQLTPTAVSGVGEEHY